MPEHAFLSKTERAYIDVILKDGTYHHFTPRVLRLEPRRLSLLTGFSVALTAG
jgi:hypothetical protein